MRVIGILGLIYELVWDKVEKPTIAIIFAMMAGVPSFLRADEKVLTEKLAPEKLLEDPPKAPE